MHKTNLLLSSYLLLAASILPLGSAHAEDAKGSIKPTLPNADTGQLIYNEGKGEAAACQGCHGEKALGMDTMGAPRLANIGQAYIIKQLEDFSDNKRTPEGVGAAMNDFAKALNEQDRRDLAVFLDNLELVDDPSDLKALAADGVKVGDPALGRIIVTKGIKGKLPACQDCHGFNGRASRFPRINQQKYVYLINQLNAWRSGSRANDLEVEKVGIMRGIAKKLSDDDILNIAAYLSTASIAAP